MERTKVLLTSVAIAGALGAGALAGFVLGVPGLSSAQTPAASASPAPGPKSGPHVRPGLSGPAARLKGAFLDTAAKALGITTADLQQDLKNGQSIADVAKAKSVDLQTVITALTNEATTRIDAAVKAGKLTDAQATKAKANLTNRISALVNRTPQLKPPAGVTPTVMPALGLGGAASLDAAANALGISTAELQQDLKSGQSIAAVATAKGVDVQSVITALTNDANSRIDAAVKAGKLTDAQAAKLKNALATRITALVNATPGTSPRGRLVFPGLGRPGLGGPRLRPGGPGALVPTPKSTGSI